MVLWGIWGQACVIQLRVPWWCNDVYLTCDIVGLQMYGGLLQYIPRNMHTVFALLCFCCGYTLTDFPIFIRLTSLALWQSNDCPVPAKQPWWIWINTSCESIMNDCITTAKQSTTKPCAYFLGYTVHARHHSPIKTNDKCVVNSPN